jgi:YHS domain-containing protein
MKQWISFLLAAGSLLAVDLADPVNASRKGVAIRGYDPVAYFIENRPQKGSPAFTEHWMGATWQFANEANKSIFQSSPEKYAPQFGGYCAYAASENYIYDADPDVWRIVDGKLYLNYNQEAKKRWEASLYDRIQTANKNWPGLHK